MMPYSLAYLKNFLDNNVDIDVQALDLNAKFHRIRFPEYYAQLGDAQTKESYGELLTAFDKTSRPVYAENHKRVMHGGLPDCFAEIIQYIEEHKPDIVAFSFVYNSQGFYGKCLVDALREKGIPCLVGGPAVASRIREQAVHLRNEVEMVQYLTTLGATAKEGNYTTIPDFSDFPQEDYFSRERIIPIKTSSTCFYKQCTFCTHFAQVPYVEYDLDNIKKTVRRANARYVYVIDDMISRTRLLVLADVFGPLGVRWWCQLRPTADLVGILPRLYAGGLRVVSWGVESGSQRILDLMQKGTQIGSVKQVLVESHAAGIKNMVYIMFAFPTETHEEFFETITFLQENQQNIDLVSTSIFGLQKGAKVYKQPAQYGVLEVIEKDRTILDPSITYTVSSGLGNDEARVLQKRYQKRIETINKLPKVYNYFKEQTLLL